MLCLYFLTLLSCINLVSVILTILKYVLYMLIYFTLHISEFSVQRTLYNQPGETYVQNHKIRWSDEGRDFNGIPFIILGTKVLDC